MDQPFSLVLRDGSTRSFAGFTGLRAYAPMPGNNVWPGTLHVVPEIPKDNIGAPALRASREAVNDKVCAGLVDPTRFSAYAVEIDDDGNKVSEFSAGADVVRYPASMTKMMTLLIAMDDLTQGRIAMDDKVSFSKHALAASPVNLSAVFRRLGTHKLSLGNTLFAIGVRSANDAARAAAEHIAGSEAAFVARMNEKARAIGMNRTHFANASGLPDPHNVSTARDMTTLMRHIDETYPKFAQFLGTRGFDLREKINGKRTIGALIRGHIAMLQRFITRDLKVDKAKTGYINASGSNIAVHATGEGRNVEIVVMGARGSAARHTCVARIASRL